MKRTPLAEVLALIVALLSAGCSNVFVQRRLVNEAESRLRVDYNQGACGRIYDEADDRFRRSKSRETWLLDCESMRERLGPWRAFTVTSRNSWVGGDPGVLWIQGLATFENGARPLRVDWTIVGERARLDDLHLPEHSATKE